MGLLGLFGSKKKETVVLEAPPCPHAVLLPRWDSVEDMGNDEKATRFTCEACQTEFTPEQARELRGESVTARLLSQEEAEKA
jgi:hypothetical protein